MKNVKELERAITNLSPEDYKELRDWFERYETELWDKQFEKDVKSGKLNTFANEAIQEYKNSGCSEL
jgi:hypothetical protein